MDYKEFLEKKEEITRSLNRPGISDGEKLIYLQSLKGLCARAFELHNIDAAFERDVKDTLFSVEQQIKAIKQSMSMGSMPYSSNSMGTSPSTSAGNQSQEVNPSSFSPMESIISGSNKASDEPLESINAGAFDPNSSPILRKLLKTQQNLEEINASAAGTNILKQDSRRSLELIFPQFNVRKKVPFDREKVVINRALIQELLKEVNLPEHSFSEINANVHCLIELRSNGSLLLSDPESQSGTYFKGEFLTNTPIQVSVGDEIIVPILYQGKRASLKIIIGEVL